MIAGLGLSLIFGAGCKKKPQPPSHMTYMLVSKDLSLVGVTAIVGGKRKEFESKDYSTNETKAMVFSVPTTGPSALASMAIEVITPCGGSSIALKTTMTEAAETMARQTGGILRVEVTPASPVPGAIDVWVDAGPSKGTVEVGTVKLQQGRNRLFDVTCSRSLDFKVNGVSFATLPPIEPETKAFFVTPTDQCYAYEGVGYGPGSHSYRSVLRGKHVYPLATPQIDYFLRSAPSTSRSYDFVEELTVTSCGQ